jgi:sirohydrochlorin ferrochelatase
MRTALLLIAHGSRNPEANEDLCHVARSLEARGHPTVEASFLELAEPGIDEGGRRCVVRGGERVVLVPYFLSAGVHVRRDLTAARDPSYERLTTPSASPETRSKEHSPVFPGQLYVGAYQRSAEAARE